MVVQWISGQLLILAELLVGLSIGLLHACELTCHLMPQPIMRNHISLTDDHPACDANSCLSFVDLGLIGDLEVFEKLDHLLE